LKNKINYFKTSLKAAIIAGIITIQIKTINKKIISLKMIINKNLVFYFLIIIKIYFNQNIKDTIIMIVIVVAQTGLDILNAYS
jgi:hypothetical protein